jgi:hypothetical protein
MESSAGIPTIGSRCLGGARRVEQMRVQGWPEGPTGREGEPHDALHCSFEVRRVQISG